MPGPSRPRPDIGVTRLTEVTDVNAPTEPRELVEAAAVVDVDPPAEPGLLLDEGEAVLTRRTEVRDAHDRYADLEVDPPD